LEVALGGQLAELAAPRLRVVLALLIAGAGRVVSVTALVEGLWRGDPPADAKRTVQAYVSLLRKTLQPATGPAPAPTGQLVVTRRPGYLLRIGPDAVDAARFERLAAAGRRTLTDGRPVAAAGELAAGLALWRGEAYGEFGDIAALQVEGARLEQVRLSALQDRIEADLAAGVGAELVAELEGLTGRHPGHERLWGQLMTALYRGQRQTDALAVYRRAREALIEASGVEPSAKLAEIHRLILTQDPQLLAAPAVHAGGRPTAGPTQLPPAVRGFTGRVGELARLDALLPAAGPDIQTTVVISAVSGTAGVGKTALAVHWAHRVADRFPDGQLYVNLRGFAAGGQLMGPAEAIRGFLDALGVPADRIPPSLDARAALYRSTVAGRRLLVVLDNARDAEQVRLLLPGTPTTMVVVTSRNQLTGLVAADGAHPIQLDLLSRVEAHELLSRRLGPGRVTAEPQAVEDIVGACARLPLALVIAAAHAAQTGFPLTVLAAELADSGKRLGVLDAGDPATAVRAVFSWSYRALTPPAARLFRLLGLHPGPDVSAAAAASLAGQRLAELRPLLAELARASLVTEHAPGRHALHDLLRAYAAELCGSTDAEPSRRAAIGRLLDHYLHTAHAADRLLDPTRDPIAFPLAGPAAGAAAEVLVGLQPAMGWLDAEHPVLLAVHRLADGTGHDVQSWQLAWVLHTFLQRRGHWHALTAAWRIALRAAHRLADPTAEALAHRLLASALLLLAAYPEAHRHLERALDLYTRTGNLIGQASAQLNLGILWERQGLVQRALDHDQQALALFRAAGHRRGEAGALNAVGWDHTVLGDHAKAIVYCEQALAVQRQIGDRVGEAASCDSLGYAHYQLGHYAEAAAWFRYTVGLYRALGDPPDEADTLTHLGDTQHAAGALAAARATWQQALDILIDLDHPDAAAVRAKLDALDQPAGPSTADLAAEPPPR
jgi:DNA-binding SARP family transcriptional activator/tetratricopeptide (TPR) repeat protein